MGAIPSFSGREGEKALSDLQYKEGRKEPDFVLEMNLRQWMMARPRLLDPEVQPLLKRLHEFARHVQSAGFGRALKNLAGDIADCSGQRFRISLYPYMSFGATQCDVLVLRQR